MILRPPISTRPDTRFPHTTLFRAADDEAHSGCPHFDWIVVGDEYRETDDRAEHEHPGYDTQDAQQVDVGRSYSHHEDRGAHAHQQGCQHPEDTELADGESRERCTHNAADVCRDRPRGGNWGGDTLAGEHPPPHGKGEIGEDE